MNNPNNKDLERWRAKEEFRQDHLAEWHDEQREKFEAMDRHDESGHWRHFK
jgi:hypothetical protein